LCGKGFSGITSRLTFEANGRNNVLHVDVIDVNRCVFSYAIDTLWFSLE